MGHQFARAAVAATLIVAAGCGGGDDDEPPSVLDNALAQVDQHDVGTAVSPSGDAGVAARVEELPPPDPSLFVGANRIVNLWVGADGSTREFDVWGRRTFASGPVLLVEALGYGDASGYAAAPPEYQLAVVGAGAGPDGEELATVINAVDGEQITTILVSDDDGSVVASNLWEVDPSGNFGAPAPPADGKGVIELVAPNTEAFGDELTASVGGRAFYVGDGAGECLRQRAEEAGFQPDVLGGTQRVQVEVEPGETAVSLHPWPSPDTCGQPPSATFDVVVPEDGVVLVLAATFDGSGLDALVLPVG